MNDGSNLLIGRPIRLLALVAAVTVAGPAIGEDEAKRPDPPRPPMQERGRADNPERPGRGQPPGGADENAPRELRRELSKAREEMEKARKRVEELEQRLAASQRENERSQDRPSAPDRPRGGPDFGRGGFGPGPMGRLAGGASGPGSGFPMFAEVNRRLEEIERRLDELSRELDQVRRSARPRVAAPPAGDRPRPPEDRRPVRNNDDERRGPRDGERRPPMPERKPQP